MHCCSRFWRRCTLSSPESRESSRAAPLLTKSARNAGMAVFGLVTLAVASLEYFFFTDNFSMAYVAEHSNRALPLFYKFAALWAGQEGSLLFWSWLLSIYAFSRCF